MIAGRMRYRLRVYRPESSNSGFGRGAVKYSFEKVIWAERETISGSRSVEAGEVFADYRVTFKVRDAHAVCEGWRVEERGGRLYEVTNVIPNIARGMKVLRCERVNQ